MKNVLLSNIPPTTYHVMVAFPKATGTFQKVLSPYAHARRNFLKQTKERGGYVLCHHAEEHSLSVTLRATSLIIREILGSISEEIAVSYEECHGNIGEGEVNACTCRLA